MDLEIDKFNQNYPVGSAVIYTDDFGNETVTITESIAWDLCGTPVASLKGKRGGHDIERIRKYKG